ncbi:hypothetical protein GCM10027589_17520 [Actinocorallia lasiicapitis]
MTVTLLIAAALTALAARRLHHRDSHATIDLAHRRDALSTNGGPVSGL